MLREEYFSDRSTAEELLWQLRAGLSALSHSEGSQMLCSALGDLFSPPEGEWLLRPAALAVVSRALVSDHPSLSGFSVLVCV